MACATSPSAMAWTSSGCIPQKSAICVKVRAVFSISHTAVAFGIKGRVMACHLQPGERCTDRRALGGAKPGYDLWLGVGQERPPGLCCGRKTQENRMALEEDAPPRPRARLEKLPLDSLGIEE